MGVKGPVTKEIKISVSYGGKFQLKKYEIQSDFHIGLSETYELPPDWTDMDVLAFRYEKHSELQKLVEGFADKEIDKLIEAKNSVG